MFALAIFILLIAVGGFFGYRKLQAGGLSSFSMPKIALFGTGTLDPVELKVGKPEQVVTEKNGRQFIFTLTLTQEVKVNEEGSAWSVVIRTTDRDVLLEAVDKASFTYEGINLGTWEITPKKVTLHLK
jgi:hypothetical protein